DGIRDRNVTGVQTCALPIFMPPPGQPYCRCPGGGIIYDAGLKLSPESFGRDDITLFPVPYMDLLVDSLKEFGKERELSKYQVMRSEERRVGKECRCRVER